MTTNNNTLLEMVEKSLFDSIPSEISQHLVTFSGSIQEAWDIIMLYKEAMKTSEIELGPMQRVQTELSLTYAMNALFFIYLRCNGIDVKNHQILKELERLTACLKRCQTICGKQMDASLAGSKHTRLDKQASQRFVRHALWQQAQSKTSKKRKMEAAAANNSHAAEEGNEPIDA